MQYLLLIYEDEKGWAKMTEAERGKIFAEYGQFTEGIKKGGQHLGSNPLQPTSTATTVRVRNGKQLTTDGPFAETKEQLPFKAAPASVARLGGCGSVIPDVESLRNRRDSIAPPGLQSLLPLDGAVGAGIR